MWRFLLPLRRAEVEFPVATQHLDDASVLAMDRMPWPHTSPRTPCLRHPRNATGTGRACFIAVPGLGGAFWPSETNRPLPS